MQGGMTISTGSTEEAMVAILCRCCSMKQSIGNAANAGEKRGEGEWGRVEENKLPEDAWEQQLAHEKEQEKIQWKERGRSTREQEEAGKEQREAEAEAGMDEKRRTAETERIYKRLKTRLEG